MHHVCRVSRFSNDAVCDASCVGVFHPNLMLSIGSRSGDVLHSILVEQMHLSDVEDAFGEINLVWQRFDP